MPDHRRAAADWPDVGAGAMVAIVGAETIFALEIATLMEWPLLALRGFSLVPRDYAMSCSDVEAARVDNEGNKSAASKGDHDVFYFAEVDAVGSDRLLAQEIGFNIVKIRSLLRLVFRGGAGRVLGG